MSLNGIGIQGEKIESGSGQHDGVADTKLGYSKVVSTEVINENERKITIEIPLQDGSIISVTGTLGELIQIRKKLELEGKIPTVSNHDDEAKRNLLDMQDITRWEYGGRGSTLIIDVKAEKEKKKRAAQRQKKMIEDIKQSLYDGRASIISTGAQSKKALFEVLILSEEKIAQLFSKKNLQKTSKVLSKTGDIIGGIIEKGIYYAMPSIEGSIPHVKKKIYMTGKQLFDILSGKKIVSHESKDGDITSPNTDSNSNDEAKSHL